MENMTELRPYPSSCTVLPAAGTRRCSRDTSSARLLGMNGAYDTLIVQAELADGLRPGDRLRTANITVRAKRGILVRN